jgi:predicted enzyme related to lactoylglutathione lyase
MGVLLMAERKRYEPGTPTWVDLTTINLDPAKAFYGGLFNWEFDTGPAEYGYYTMCRKQGRNVAGIMPRQPGQDTPPTWNTYLATDNLDATVQTAREAGATITVEPMDIMDQGRMAYLIDPSGAPIGLWQARAHIGAELVGEPDTMIWNELHTPDAAAADAFYRRLFPYQLDQVGDGEDFDYAVFRIGQDQVAGRMRATPDMPPHWMPYFAVEDVDKVAQRVGEQTGTVLNGPMDSPYGRLAPCRDPWGADFAIITPPQG